MDRVNPRLFKKPVEEQDLLWRETWGKLDALEKAASNRIRRLARIVIASPDDGEKTGDYTSVGMFIPIPAKYGKHFPQKEEDKSPPHITFLYVGAVPQEREEEFLGLCKRTLKRHGPVKATLVGYDEFENHKGETIAHVDIGFNVDMAAVRRELRRELMDAGFEVGDSFLGYKPHSTLAYLEDGETYDGKVPVGSFDVKNVEVWGLSSVRKIPLT